VTIGFSVVDLSALPVIVDQPGPYVLRPRWKAEQDVLRALRGSGRFVFVAGHRLLVWSIKP
jgi:hypothetical protein